jgi:hypothetical protein
MQMRSISMEPVMQKLLNTLLKRNVSTQRVDDMASVQAVSALDRRVNKMLSLQATQPVPQPHQFAHLSNPNQIPAIS